MYHCAVLFFQHTHIILVHPYIHTTYTHVSTQKETKCLLIKYWHKGFTGPPPPPPLPPPPASSNTSVLMDGDSVYICMRMPTCVCVCVCMCHWVRDTFYSSDHFRLIALMLLSQTPHPPLALPCWHICYLALTKAQSGAHGKVPSSSSFDLFSFCHCLFHFTIGQFKAQ